MCRVRSLAAPALGLVVLLAGCDSASTPAPSPVPGAAATAARAAATPIPTAIQKPAPAGPEVTGSPIRAPGSPSPAASPSPSAPGPATAAEQAAESARRSLEQALGSAELSGIEALLLDQVALASPAGGEVLERQAAARWLREHAGPGLRITEVLRHAQLPLLEIVTEGWPAREPIRSGRVTFNFHLYDPSGRQDEAGGSWKIDVIAVE
jgi:hypothetical protein